MDSQQRREWVARRLKEIRELKARDQADGGVSRQTISSLENMRTGVRLEKLELILTDYGVTLAEFFADQNKLPNQYWDTKRKQIMLKPEQQVWVDKLVKIFETENLEAIGMIQNVLKMAEKTSAEKAQVPAARMANDAIKRDPAVTLPKGKGAKAPKKETSREEKTGT